MYHKHRSLLRLKPTSEIIAATVLLAMGYAIATTLFSALLKDTGISDSNIGFITGISTLVGVVVSLFLPPILEKFNEFKLLTFSMFAIGVLYASLGTFRNVAFLAIALIFIRVLVQLRTNTAGIVFRDVAKNKAEFQRSRGILGSLANLGWVVGPVAAGLLARYSSFQMSYFIAGAFLWAGAMYLFAFPIHLKEKKRKKLDTNILENIRFYTSRPNLLIAYLQTLGVSFWWTFVWTFMPLFLLNDGYSLTYIGAFVGLTGIPLVLLEFKTTALVPKLGYKKLFLAAYGVLALLCVAAFLSASLFVVMGLFIAASLSLAVLEPITEMFFFDQVTTLEEERTYPIYSTSLAAGTVTVRILVAIVIATLGTNASFLFIATVFFLIAISATTIRTQPKTLS